jgi:predicted MFS family arabinose efflux permease
MTRPASRAASDTDTAASDTDGPVAVADATDPAVDERPPRPTSRLLIDRTVGSYFAAKLLASMGIWVHNVVAAIVVYQITGSALLVGAVSVAQFSPQLLLSPWMGAVADRGNRRLQVVAGRLMTAAGSLGLAAWIAVTGVDGLTAAPVVASALVVGMGFAVSAPAMQALVPTLARPNELSTVIAIAQSPMTLARAAGPALGAFLLLTTGPTSAFAVAGVCQAVFALVVWRLHMRPVKRPKSKDTSVRGGFRYLRSDRAVVLLLFAVAAMGFGIDPVITLTPSLADGFGGGAELVASMASAFGAGAGVTVFMIGQFRKRLTPARLGSVGLSVLAGSLVVLAVSPTPAVAVAALFVGGSAMITGITSLTTQVQQRIPEDLRGRVMALWTVCWIGSRPLAAAFNGSVADYWSPQAAIAISAALLAVGAILTRPSRVRRASA